jgi:hypothetical protein
MIFFYFFIIGVPLLLILFCINKIMNVRAIKENGIQTDAVVTHIRLIRHSKGSSDSVKLEYADGSGNRHAAKVTTAPGHYKIGNTVPLKYQQQKPSRYIIDGMLQGQWFLFILSVLLFAFAIFASFKVDEMLTSGNY